VSIAGETRLTWKPGQSKKNDYSSPSSSPWLDVGAPPSIDGTPAGGAAFAAAFGAAAGVFAADRGAAFFAGFLAAARLAGFFAALRFAGFFAVFAAFFVVFVFLLPPFLAPFFAGIGNPPVGEY
jgi:hypothetical protein